jgi:FMN-dependent NADH-azoreductase
MGDLSYSLRGARAFLDAYRAAHPKDTVDTLDVFSDAVPPFTFLEAAAKYAVLHGKQPSGEEARAWRTVEAVIERFKAADRYLVSSPMWNFGIPYRLKQFFDVIVQPTYTFSYSPETGYTGLVTGKRAVLVLARGGAYGPGSGGEALDHQRPYLETILSFMGVTDVQAVVIEPTLMGGPDTAADAAEAACEEAREIARAL